MVEPVEPVAVGGAEGEEGEAAVVGGAEGAEGEGGARCEGDGGEGEEGEGWAPTARKLIALRDAGVRGREGGGALKNSLLTQFAS